LAKKKKVSWSRLRSTDRKLLGRETKNEEKWNHLARKPARQDSFHRKQHPGREVENNELCLYGKEDGGGS